MWSLQLVIVRFDQIWSILTLQKNWNDLQFETEVAHFTCVDTIRLIIHKCTHGKPDCHDWVMMLVLSDHRVIWTSRHLKNIFLTEFLGSSSTHIWCHGGPNCVHENWSQYVSNQIWISRQLEIDFGLLDPKIRSCLKCESLIYYLIIWPKNGASMFALKT